MSVAPEGRRRTTSRWFEGFIEGPLHAALKNKMIVIANVMQCSIFM